MLRSERLRTLRERDCAEIGGTTMTLPFASPGPARIRVVWPSRADRRVVIALTIACAVCALVDVALLAAYLA